MISKRNLIICVIIIFICCIIAFVAKAYSYIAAISLISILIISILLANYAFGKLTFLYTYYIPGTIPFFIKKTGVTLDINEDGSIAKYSKHQSGIVLKNNIKGYRLSNLSTAGSINKNSIELDENSEIVRFTQSYRNSAEKKSKNTLNKYEVLIDFKKSYNSGERFQRSISFTFSDTFTDYNEFFIVRIILPTDEYDILIRWPEDYNVDSIYLLKSYPMEEVLEEESINLPINAEKNHNYIRHKIFKPKVGSVFSFKWKRKIDVV